MAPPVIDLTGQRFGRLVVLGPLPHNPNAPIKWLCRCDCGTTKAIQRNALKSGTTTSCGCYRREWNVAAHTTHGMCGTPEYRAWVAMIQRCEDRNIPAYERYGRRGIAVCPQWRASFESFYRDMGPRPSPRHSLDRIDNDGDYEDANCEWVLPHVQANNRRPPRKRRHHM